MTKEQMVEKIKTIAVVVDSLEIIVNDLKGDVNTSAWIGFSLNKIQGELATLQIEIKRLNMKINQDEE